MDKATAPRPSGALSAGFTLIEVMISLAVLAFVLLAFLSIMSSASQLSMSSKEAMIAAFELQSAVEDVCAYDFGLLAQKGPQGLLLPAGTGLQNPPNSANVGPLNSVSYNVPFVGGAAPNPLSSPFVPAVTVNAAGTPTFSGGKYAALQNEALSFTWTAMDKVNKPITWAEFRIDITWTNFKGKQQSDSMTTRRSR